MQLHVQPLRNKESDTEVWGTVKVIFHFPNLVQYIMKNEDISIGIGVGKVGGLFILRNSSVAKIAHK